VANCHWRLIPLTEFKNQNITVAFAHWIDFYSNDDALKLFYVKVNFETKEVNFYHKLTAENKENVVLRNAKDTSKTIKTIKEVLTQEEWAKYLNYENLETLRNEIVTELVSTSKSFLEVKKKFVVK
jgi:hypothetical protein